MKAAATWFGLACGVAAIVVFAVVLSRPPVGLLVLARGSGHIDIAKPALRSGSCLASLGVLSCGDTGVVVASSLSPLVLTNARDDVMNVRGDSLSIALGFRVSPWSLELGINVLTGAWRRTSIGDGLELWKDEPQVDVDRDVIVRRDRRWATLAAWLRPELSLMWRGEEDLWTRLSVSEDPDGFLQAASGRDLDIRTKQLWPAPR